MRFMPIALFAGLAVLFLVSLFMGDPQDLPSALTGKPVPQFSLPPIEGSAEGTAGLQSADLATGEMVLLNVWASWCGPCREEHDELMELKAAGIKIFGLNYKDKPQDALRFLSSLGNPFTQIGADRQGRVAIDFGVYGVPETFIINGDGLIIYRHVGPLDAEILINDIYPRLDRERPSAEE